MKPIFSPLRFWPTSDQNSSFHGNIKLSLNFNLESIVSTLAPPFSTGSPSFNQVTSATIKSRTVSKFSN